MIVCLTIAGDLGRLSLERALERARIFVVAKSVRSHERVVVHDRDWGARRGQY
jgi:hypothetical protein